MKMKYFRLMYGEAGAFLVHLGEVTDTKEQKQFTFLYVRTVEKPVRQSDSGHALFLCPKHIDLAVLDVPGEQLEQVFELPELQQTQVDTLVIAAAAEEERQKVSVTKAAVQRTMVVAQSFQYAKAGWNVVVRRSVSGRLSVAHGLSEDEAVQFDDCVMHVKVLDSDSRCMREAHPDSYGCALGCVLHRDYDVCRFRNDCSASVWPNGTLILSGDESFDTVCRELGVGQENVRFCVLPSEGQKIGCRTEETRVKRYYIGSERETDAAVIAEIAKSGIEQIPVMVGEAKGLCCSGFFKYAEVSRSCFVQGGSEDLPVK